MWSTVWLKVPPRRCRVTETVLECVGEDGALSVGCANVDDVVGLSLRFLHEGASLDNLAADPRVLRQ